ncbi:Transcriptional regulator, DeoR family [hydrothermal vent metagenome]|uniref:Transcriptional regulator, DeoR family n=1 Tax=hydrothermal vent metagenome TaxID=652676 RepID=A0A3B0Y685_9ZZZZ
MRRADRLFQIVQFLRSRRITTAHWLSEVLEVSERTIYRDIQDLMSSSVPIAGEAGVGYVIRRGYDLPPLMFTREELAALTLGARIVTSWADPALVKAAESVLSKVELAVPESLKGVLDQTRLYSPLERLSVEVASFMGDLRSAIDSKKKVTVSYTRADGMLSQRTLWPLGLFFWGNVWTLGSWCESRAAFRNFRLDRISRLKVEEVEYRNQKGRTLADMITWEKDICRNEKI